MSASGVKGGGAAVAVAVGVGVKGGGAAVAVAVGVGVKGGGAAGGCRRKGQVVVGDADRGFAVGACTHTSWAECRRPVSPTRHRRRPCPGLPQRRMISRFRRC